MMNGKKYDVVVAGYLGIDLIPEFRKSKSYRNIGELLVPGKLTEVAGLQLIPGGVVANTGMALKRFNKKVLLNGITGDDFIGKIVGEKLREYGLYEGIKTVAGASTAFGIVIAPPGIDRIFLEYPGCNEVFALKDIDIEAISQSRIMHFGYPPLLREFFINDGKQLVDLFSAVNNMQVVTSLDLSLPDAAGEAGTCDWPFIMKKVFPVTDIFAPSVEELLFIMQRTEYDHIRKMAGEGDIVDFISIDTIRKLGKRILDFGVSILLIKMAHRGMYLLTGDISRVNHKGMKLDVSAWNYTELHCEAYPVDDSRYKNASGAGDTAVAAFLSALIEGHSPGTCLKYASLAGRNNLYSNEIYEELDNWEDMTHEIMSDKNGSDPVRLMSPV